MKIYPHRDVGQEKIRVLLYHDFQDHIARVYDMLSLLFIEGDPLLKFEY